jgi:UDP-N-acetylmuramoylalanine--D-glutamate ligase
MLKYAQAKFKICKFQDSNDYFLYNAHDEESKKLLSSVNEEINKIAVDSEQFQNGIVKSDGSLMQLALKGKHNLYNSFVVKTYAELIGLTEDQIEAGLSTFVNLPHRLEIVRELDGVTYINDSKATNVDSVFYALDAMTTSVVWIVGGQDKGNDYSVLFPLIDEKVKAIICLGADNSKLLSVFEGKDIISTHNVEDAIKMARNKSQVGDTILLSPACASFDLFKNYMDRGDQFRNEVNKLK